MSSREPGPMSFSALLIAAVVVAFPAPPAPAQDSTTDREAPETAKPYVPPSAPRSVEVGIYYLRRKKYVAALSRFQEAVKTDPYYPPGYLGLGKVYEKIGLKQKALDAYRKYLDTLPSTKEAEEAKEVHEAIARLERDVKTQRRGTRGRPSGSDSSPPSH
jgi:tetratricopeptide (TPR) repeat protein